MNDNDVFLLLDEPDLTIDQVWWVVARSDDDTMIQGVVIADTFEELEKAVQRRRGYQLFSGDQERGVLNMLSHVIQGDYNAEQLDLIAHGLVSRQGADEIRDHLVVCLNVLREVRRSRGTGAVCDGRKYESTLVRNRLLAEERMGQDAYWKMHPNVTPELLAIPFPEWVAEVRALGRAAFDAGVNDIRDHMARSKAEAGKGTVQ